MHDAGSLLPLLVLGGLLALAYGGYIMVVADRPCRPPSYRAAVVRLPNQRGFAYRDVVVTDDCAPTVERCEAYVGFVRVVADLGRELGLAAPRGAGVQHPEHVGVVRDALLEGFERKLDACARLEGSVTAPCGLWRSPGRAGRQPRYRAAALAAPAGCGLPQRRGGSDRQPQRRTQGRAVRAAHRSRAAAVAGPAGQGGRRRR